MSALSRGHPADEGSTPVAGASPGLLEYLPVSSTDTSVAQAYAACASLARAHYENFPVASRLLPRRMRPHVAAVYAFARVADDFADEGDRSPDERHRLLDQWLARLHACAAAGSGSRRHNLDEVPRIQHEALFLALGHTIRVCKLPLPLFEDLVSAFRQDITTHRYATWDELLDYCRRSANPVGRLVLRIAGYEDPALDRASDSLCSALQLTNFWQDLERDCQRGRLYVPAADREACAASEADLVARRLTAEWRCALARVSSRTSALFVGGRSVCDGVRGRLGFELRLTWLGGMRILDRLERADYDVFAARPALSIADGLPMLWHAMTWRRRDSRSGIRERGVNR